MIRSDLNGFWRAFTEDNLPARPRHHELLTLDVRAGLDDQLERPDDRAQLAREAERLARQREGKRPVVVHLRRRERQRLDVLDVLRALAARVPEQPQLGRLRRLVDLPRDAAADRLAGLVAALSAGVDPERAHVG